MMKLKLVTLSLVLTLTSILGACATSETQVPADDNSGQLSESTELEGAGDIEEPSLMEETDSLEETAIPEGDVPSELEVAPVEVAPVEGEATETPMDFEENAIPEAEGNTFEDTTMPEAEDSTLEDVTTPEAEVEPVPVEGAE